MSELTTPRHESAGDESGARPAVPVDITGHQLGVALTWLRRGLPVVPCSRTDKGALVAGFGMNASPERLAQFSDADTVRRWWTGRYRRAHVGILGGRAVDASRGLVVVDLDMSKTGEPLDGGRFAGAMHGADVLEHLADEAGADWPETYTVRTPSGGEHLYFRQPDDGPVIGCATGDGTTPPHIGPLVDVRGIGGYVIAAGSYSSAQGTPYTRTSPAGLAPQELPAWLLAIMRRPAPARPATPAPARELDSTATRAERYAQAALEGALGDVRDAPDGTGNDTLNACAYRLGRLANTAPRVLGESAVESELLAAARAAGQPEAAALRTIRSGWSAGTANPKTTPATTAGAA